MNNIKTILIKIGINQEEDLLLFLVKLIMRMMFFTFIIYKLKKLIEI
jgi:flagellar biogenesis protein FliO